jgi:glycosyltransferase involved in cell wall biosynthesis
MTNEQPTISAIVVCRNERNHIEDCVRSLLQQEPPPGGFELIVVDGMSDDGTREILRELSIGEKRLRVLDNPGQFTASGMNTGLREARGRSIAIMGAHHKYAQDYLRRSVEALARTGADAVGGAMFCLSDSYLQRAISAAHHSAFAVGGARWHNPDYEGPADTVYGGIYRREVFDRIGHFDEELIRNQDDEFNLRLTRQGGKIWQCPEIKSWYWPRSSLRGLCAQYCQYGYWKVRVAQKHKLPASVRHLVPASFLLLVGALSLSSIWSVTARWLLAAVMGIYFAASLLASVLAAAKYGWSVFPVMPTVFTCYHVAYGYGFLRGLLDFGLILRRNNKFAQLNH